jgi:redox-sensitive bicupin YhaK (pirin superfamily)
VTDPDVRGRSSQPGIESWHCFSSGPYYDPERISLGPIVGVDEHLVAPGAGFDWHAHRGVHIASWVLSGTLHHQDSTGAERYVTPGALFVQSTGWDGIRHREWNASDGEPLRFVQITVLGEAEYAVRSAGLPAKVGGVTVDFGAGRVPPAERRFVLALDDGSLVLEYDG